MFKTNFPEVEWGLEWIDLAKDRNMWRGLVSAEINFRVA
jgi:hypothetical protein